MGWCLVISLLLAICSSHGLWDDLKDQEKQIQRRCPPELQSCIPSQLEWAELDEQLDGKLVWPDSRFNYSAYNYQYSLRTFTYPLVHVVCETVPDIQNAVKFAKKHNLRVTIKSSGIDLWGRSSAHGSFSINLMDMKRISVNASKTDRSEYGEVAVETGATFAEIYTVVVLADGRVATCTENKTVIVNGNSSETLNNGELFWALRGGGGGTFGVVVHYVLKLQIAPASIVSASISMVFYQNETDTRIANAFFDVYNSWVQTAPSYWGGYVYFSNAPVTSNSIGTVKVYLNKFGPWDENTTSELQPFYDLMSSYPSPLVNITVNNHTFFWSDYLSKDRMYGVSPRSYTLGALIPPEKHNNSLRDFFFGEFMDSNNGELHCNLVRLGGKVKEFSEKSSSVHAGFRKAQSHAVCFLTTGSRTGIDSYRELERLEMIAARFSEKLREFGDGEYISDGFIPNLENLEARLLGKTLYKPTGGEDQIR